MMIDILSSYDDWQNIVPRYLVVLSYVQCGRRPVSLEASGASRRDNPAFWAWVHARIIEITRFSQNFSVLFASRTPTRKIYQGQRMSKAAPAILGELIPQ